jgi:hypothetical protein
MGHIADGKYLARAKSWSFGVAGTGTEQFAIEFEIADDGDENGKRITWYGFFNTEENGRRAIKSMRACGWDESGDPMEPTGLDKNEVELDIQEEEYNGKSTSKVRWVNALGAGINMKPLAADQKAKLTGKLRQWMQPTAGGQRRGPAPAQTTRPAPQTKKTEGAFDPGPAVEDDIPF